MPVDPETGRYWTPRYRSKAEVVRTICACVSACGTLLVLLRVFGIL